MQTIEQQQNALLELRQKFYDLTAIYIEQMMQGKSLRELREINSELNDIAIQIDELETTLVKT